MHRKCAIKDRGVEQGRAVVWSRAGQCARSSTVSLLLSVPALTIPHHCLNTFLTRSGDSQQGHPARPLCTVSTTSSHKPGSGQESQLQSKHHSITTWFYFQCLKLLINLLWASLFLSGFPLARLWLLSGLRKIHSGPVLCLARLWQATSSSGSCQASTSMNEHLASQTTTEQGLPA